MKKLSILCLVTVLLASCTAHKKATREITTASGLRYTVIQSGTGKPAQQGQDVAIYESTSYLSGPPLCC